MDILEGLQQLHLTKNEAIVYKSLLEKGVGTPLSIANTTGLKRPTVYLVLEALRRKQLAGLTFRGKKTSYSAERPARLIEQAKEMGQIAEKLVPFLQQLVPQPSGKPTIRYFENREEIKKIFDKEISRANNASFITNMSVWDATFPGEVEEWKKTFLSLKLSRRTLIPNNASNKPYLEKKRSPGSQVRILPRGFVFDYDISLWKKNVALYSFQNKYLLIISDEALTNVLQSLFNIVWCVSSTLLDTKTQRALKKFDRRAH